MLDGVSQQSISYRTVKEADTRIVGYRIHDALCQNTYRPEPAWSILGGKETEM